MNNIIFKLNSSLCTLAALIAFTTSAAHAEPPVKVYILAGQSNMQGKGGIEGDGTTTLRYMVENDPKKEYQGLVDEAGEWVEREDVWMHYDLAPFRGVSYGPLKPGNFGGQIGPELGFGHVIGDAYEGKVLLIKAAWGGKSLAHNFQPPSIGNYAQPDGPDDPGYFYHQTLNLVNEVTANIETFFPNYQGQGIEIAGLAWHQGWNDQYGEGIPESYERNMAAFIKDIRSEEHGLGIPNLPVVIATSGMIEKDSPIKDGQLAMGDTEKYPEFAGNVAVVDTDKPYGPGQMKFKFYTEKNPDSVGYHWNNHANSYFNIGRALAAEMLKLDQPNQLPARFTASGTAKGVRLNWQLGSETPKRVEIMRNGKKLSATIDPTQIEFVDTDALPGKNDYQLAIATSSGKKTLSASSDTSIAALGGYPSVDGVMLNWEAKGNYEGFLITRGNQVIADNISADVRSFEDKDAPKEGKLVYAIKPKRGEEEPLRWAVNLGPLGPDDAGGALVYEPFNYPAKEGEPQLLTGKGGALGTQGVYTYLSDEAPNRAPAVMAGGLSYGDLPVTGNRAAGHRWSSGVAIELDDSLKKAGLLDDGATLWMSYVFVKVVPMPHRSGPGGFSLRSKDLKEGIGFKADRQFETVVYVDGEGSGVRITGVRDETPTLVVGKIVWGKDGADDTFIPYTPGFDLKLPEEHGRPAKPFNIDQSKLSHLMIQQEGHLDEIRIGPTFESVIGAGE